MSNRRAVEAATLSAVAAQIAARPISDANAAVCAAIYEPLLQGLDRLRSLPLADIEPAVTFTPRRDG